MKEEQRLRADRQNAEFELRNRELENRQIIENKREERQTAEFKAQQSITRFIIGAITFAFAGSLGLAVVNKDSTRR
jgi:hypothetical protein